MSFTCLFKVNFLVQHNVFAFESLSTNSHDALEINVKKPNQKTSQNYTSAMSNDMLFTLNS